MCRSDIIKILEIHLYTHAVEKIHIILFNQQVMTKKNKLYRFILEVSANRF